MLAGPLPRGGGRRPRGARRRPRPSTPPGGTNARNTLGVALHGQGLVEEGSRHPARGDADVAADDRPTDVEQSAREPRRRAALRRAARGGARRRGGDPAERARRPALATTCDLTSSRSPSRPATGTQAEAWMPTRERRDLSLERARTSRCAAPSSRSGAATTRRRPRLLERIAAAWPTSGEPQFHGAFGVLLAELRRRAGDLDGARAAIDEALDRIEFCTEDAMRMAPGRRGRRRRRGRRGAQRGRDLGDAAETPARAARVQDYLLRVEAAAAEGATGRVGLARRRRRRAPRAPAASDDPRAVDAAAAALGGARALRPGPRRALAAGRGARRCAATARPRPRRVARRSTSRAGSAPRRLERRARGARGAGAPAARRRRAAGRAPTAGRGARATRSG